MTFNIAALDALMPPKKNGGSASHPDTESGMTGSAPFDAWRRAGPEFVDTELALVIDAIRADSNWGPIFGGDSSHYGGDKSDGDLALCGELSRRGLSAAKIETAVRASGRFREKWDRSDYRNRTIGLVVPSLTSPVIATPATSGGLLPLSGGYLNASNVAPPPRDWVVEKMFLAGNSSVVGGLGGMSKTQLLATCAVAVATGSNFAGRVVKQGPVLFISAEEPLDEMRRRINAIIRREKLSPAIIQQINDNVKLFSLVGEDVHLTAPLGSSLQPTNFTQQIIDYVHAVGGVHLIILDHIGLFHGGTDLSSRGEVGMTMRQVNKIAAKTGAAVVFLAHSPKSSIGKDEPDAADIIGSTGFIDLSRAGFVMSSMPKKVATEFGISDVDREHYGGLTGIKANYSPKNTVMWFRRHSFDEVGVLEYVTPSPKGASSTATFTLQGHIWTTVAGAPGRYSKTSLRDGFHGVKKGPWKASKEQIAREVDDMIQAGQLVIRAPTSAERQLYGHGPQVNLVLDMPQHGGVTL